MDINRLRERYEQMKEKEGGSGNNDFLQKFMQLQDGQNLVRILPWKDESKEWYAETAIHRVPFSRFNLKGMSNNVHCLKVKGERCPACETYYKMWDNHNNADNEADKLMWADTARAIKPRERYYMNVLNRDTNEVKILSIGKKLFTTIVETVLDEDYGDITDVKTGFDFKVIKDEQKTSNGTFPNYDRSAPRPKQSAVAKTQKEIDGILAELHDIHELVQHKSPDEIRAQMTAYVEGTNDEADESDDSAAESTETVENKEVSDKAYLDRLNVGGENA